VDDLTQYVVDTVAFVRHLEDRLSPKIGRIFDEAESGRNHLYLPEIALAEFVYICLKGRLKVTRPEMKIRDVLHNLSASEAFTVSGMTPGAWEAFVSLPIPEMHDRMIAAEAIARGFHLISNDSSFEGIPALTRVW
jgi:predicted nucleic acid-binding protein